MKKKYKIFMLMLVIFLVVAYTLVFFQKGVNKLFNISYRKYYNKYLTTKELEEYRKSLFINENEFNWGDGLEFNNNPKVIIYHHTAINNISPQEIDKLHKSKGWLGIGYQYYIRKDGSIYECRPESATGAHALGNNKNSLGICVEGNLEEEVITNEQMEALENLSVYLCLKYDIEKIIGHREVCDTLCPGKNFPLDEMKNKVIQRMIDY